MLGEIKAFLYYHFITAGYTWVNTITYGLLLGLLVFYLVIPLVKKLKVEFNRYFILALVPFILFGSTTRELVDQELGWYAGHGEYPQNWWLVAPGIYITMFILTTIVLSFSLLLQMLSKLPYWIFMVVVGAILCFYNFALISANLSNPRAFLIVIKYFAIVGVITLVGAEVFGLRFLHYEYNYFLILAHMLDASATYVGIDFFGLKEKHVLPTLLISKFGTAWIMYPLKLLFLLPAIYIIDRDLRDDTVSRRLVKLVILILGLGPAIRDITLLIMM